MKQFWGFMFLATIITAIVIKSDRVISKSRGNGLFNAGVILAVLGLIVVLVLLVFILNHMTFGPTFNFG